MPRIQPRWTLNSLILSCTLGLASGWVHPDTQGLPDMGSPDQAVLPLADEQRMGRLFIRQIRAQLRVMQDPLITAYVRNLGRQLTTYADAGSRKFHFFAVDEPVINAFAGPGGYVGVYTGLILATQSESELAAVMAHEIAHVSQDHILRSIAHQGRITPLAIGMLIAAVALGAAVSPEAGMAAAVTAQAGAVQSQINFTRDNEKEADHLGIGILANAGFDPHSMPVFFETLAKSSRVYENNAPEFLRTHPVTTNRIAEAVNRADVFPYKQHDDGLLYACIRVRLQLQNIKAPKVASREMRAALEAGRYSQVAAQRYGLALALIQERSYAEAARELKWLLEQHPLQPAFILAQADLLDRQNQTAAALRKLSEALELFPDDYAMNYTYSDLLLKNRQGDLALKTLRGMLEWDPENPQLYDRLFQAAGMTGNTLASHGYRAEYLYWSGQLEAAIKQLRMALETRPTDSRTTDYYEMAKLQSRLRELLEERKIEQERS